MSAPIECSGYLNQILSIVVPAFSTMLLALFGYITYLFKQKTDASTALDKDALVKSITTQAAYKAEQDSLSIVSAGGKPLRGKEKMEIAADFVSDKLPDMPIAEAVSNIQAAVGAEPLLGTGKSLKKTKVLKP